MKDKRITMDRTLNIDHIRKRHNDANFLNERGRIRRERIKQIQEKYKHD